MNVLFNKDIVRPVAEGSVTIIKEEAAKTLQWLQTIPPDKKVFAFLTHNSHEQFLRELRQLVGPDNWPSIRKRVLTTMVDKPLIALDEQRALLLDEMDESIEGRTRKRCEKNAPTKEIPPLM